MNNIQSILFYFLFFCLSAIFIYLGNKNKSLSLNIIFFGKNLKLNIFVIVGVFIPILIGFLRYGLGTDYVAYLEIYKYHSEGIIINNNANYANSIEPLFKLLSKFSYSLTGTPLLFFGIPWASTVILTYLGFCNLLNGISAKKISFAWFSLLAIIVPFGFNQIRQALAVAILFFSVKYILVDNNRSNLKYLFSILIAFMCHTSSVVITVPLFFVSKAIFRNKINNIKRFNIITVISSFLFTIIIIYASILLKDYILVNYSHYKYVREFYRLLFVGSINIRPDNLIVFLIYFTSFIILIKNKNKLIVSEKILSAFCCIGLSLAFLSLFVMNGERFSMYLILFAPIIFFNLITNNRIMPILYSIVIFSIVMFFGWHSVTHYNSIFNDNVNLNAMHQRNYRALYSQVLCLTSIEECYDIQYYDLDVNEDEYEYEKGELWSLFI